jgi:hypothetical protein
MWEVWWVKVLNFQTITTLLKVNLKSCHHMLFVTFKILIFNLTNHLFIYWNLIIVYINNKINFILVLTNYTLWTRGNSMKTCLFRWTCMTRCNPSKASWLGSLIQLHWKREDVMNDLKTRIFQGLKSPSFCNLVI